MTTVFTRRVIAYVLDFVVVSAFMWILSYALFGVMGSKNSYTAYQVSMYGGAALIFVYFILTEKLMGASMGKAIMSLKVKSKNGAEISWLQAIVRNVTKIYWVPIIFDWLIGKLLKSDRLFNNITKTIVVDDPF